MTNERSRFKWIRLFEPEVVLAAYFVTLSAVHMLNDDIDIVVRAYFWISIGCLAAVVCVLIRYAFLVWRGKYDRPSAHYTMAWVLLDIVAIISYLLVLAFE